MTFTRPGSRWKSLTVDADSLGRGIAAPVARGSDSADVGGRNSPGASGSDSPGMGGSDSPDTGGSEWVSSGKPLPDFTIEIRSDAGRVLGERRVGRIHVRGPSVMEGYFGRDDAPIRDGWLDTGDVGFVDAGELYVTGRAKDMLVLRGQNHAPLVCSFVRVHGRVPLLRQLVELRLVVGALRVDRRARALESRLPRLGRCPARALRADLVELLVEREDFLEQRRRYLFGRLLRTPRREAFDLEEIFDTRDRIPQRTRRSGKTTVRGSPVVHRDPRCRSSRDETDGSTRGSALRAGGCRSSACAADP